MKYIFKITFILLFLINKSFAAERQIIVKWNGVEGLERLQMAEYKNDFYELAGYFQPQINPLYCAAASSVIVLNAIATNSKAPSQKDLEVTKPKVFGGGNIPFKTYSQLTFFNDKTDKIKDRKIINLKNITPENENDAKNFDPGLTLDELKKILNKVYDLKIEKVYANNSDKKSVDKFRNLVKQIVSDDDNYLIANFSAKQLGYGWGGHFSPIVAFEKSTDSILIMDVSGHNTGWYWVAIDDFVKAMNTKDGNNYRGYLVISK